ncbi:MFS drug efflux transporter [Sclerotinia borealis F-4128]|uniref:MFS drug efflux transporter n=1 Tax=Sclerotinia borealis (strain F-4128) TaxID=1432307 RepID=W9CB97_SCLBF|nr:MFS drug efflux transporter [Sclerotinia borealis F-4128]
MSHQQEKEKSPLGEEPPAGMELQQVELGNRRANPFSEVSPSDRMGENEALQQTAFESQRPKGFLWPITMIALLSTTFLFAANTTMVADFQPIIIKGFGETNKLPWISVSYELAALSVNVIWGKLHGQFDSKYLFITAVVIFEVGNVVCGSAQNMNTLIVGRAIFGMGGSGTYVGTVNIITSLLAPAERPLYMSFVGAVWCIGTVQEIFFSFKDVANHFRVGPIIGGAFADGVTWRWGFYINLCIAAASAPAYIFVLPSSKSKPAASIMARVRNIDFLGSILFIGAACSIIMAISFGGALYAWNSGNSCGKRSHFGTGILPFIGVLVVGILINGGLMGPIGIYSPWFTIGGILVIIGSALLHTIIINTASAAIYGYTAMLGFGAGLFVQAPFAVAQAKVHPLELADVSLFIICVQIGGIVFSLSISNIIFINLSTQRISALLPNLSLGEIQSLIAGVGASVLKDLSPAEKTYVLAILVHAISQMYSMLIAAGALATLLSIFMKRERLDLEIEVDAIAD